MQPSFVNAECRVKSAKFRWIFGRAENLRYNIVGEDCISSPKTI